MLQSQEGIYKAAMLEADAFLTRSDFSKAAQTFASAGAWAKEAGDLVEQNSAESGRKFAAAMDQSEKAENDAKAFEFATNAASLGFDRSEIAKRKAADVAVKIGNQALLAGEIPKASAWTERALGYMPGNELALELRKKINLADADKPASVSSKPDLHVSGLTFVYVPELPVGQGGTGGYVSKYEVTRSEYQKIVGSLPAGQPPGKAGDSTDDLPVHLSNANAVLFCQKLNDGVANATIELDYKGRFKLPSAAQYLAICGLGQNSEINSTTTVVQADAFDRIKLKDKNDTADENTGLEFNPVRSALTGPESRYKLVNVLGNAVEWADDGKLLGLSHQISGAANQSRRLVKPSSEIIPNGLVTTVRPVLVP